MTRAASFFAIVAVLLVMFATACSTILGGPDLPVLVEGGVNDGGAGDAPHGDAEKDVSKSDRPAEDGGDVAAEAGCPKGQMACGDSGTCIDSETDPKNCGGCDNDCTIAPHVDPATTTCSGGQCVYACVLGFANDCVGDASAGGDAGVGCPTNLTTPTNCGACGQACAGGTPLCSVSVVDGGAATCTVSCTGGTVNCNNSCVNNQTDPSACGSGCTPCAYLCTAGLCTGDCSPAATQCNGTTPQTCSASGEWVSGSITAGICGAACTPGSPSGCTASDNCHVAFCASAGTCSNTVASGATCEAGQACLAWYPDCDGDSYGTNIAGTTPIYSCMAPTGSPACPTGFTGSYASNDTDCCDTDKNAYPGQTAYFTVETACGATTQTSAPYDFNCDAVDEKESYGPSDCTSPSFACTLNGATCVHTPAPSADCNGSYETIEPAACGGEVDYDVQFCTTACEVDGTGGSLEVQACQ